MQQKVVYFNHFFSVFCKLQCYENKNKKYKNNGDRSQAKGESSIVKTGKLHYQTVKMHVLVFMYMKYCWEAQSFVHHHSSQRRF